MRKTICLGLIPAMAFASTLIAQSPTKEFGIDMTVASTGEDGGGDRLLSIGTPVDVRIGFLSSSNLSFEPRFSLAYLSAGGDAMLTFTPGINVLFKVGGDPRPNLGHYVTAGLLLDMTRFSGGGDSETLTQPGFGVGLGTKMGWGSNAATRYEFFIVKMMESGDEFDFDYLPGTLSFGLRLGLSFFH